MKPRAGAGRAVGIVPLHTLCLTVGGITRRPGIVDARIEPRLSAMRTFTDGVGAEVTGGPAERGHPSLAYTARCSRKNS